MSECIYQEGIDGLTLGITWIGYSKYKSLSGKNRRCFWL